VQERLPHVSQACVNEGDASFAFFAELLAQAGNKFEASGATTDDDNMMKVFHSNPTCK
jgi:hypothetical protein